MGYGIKEKMTIRPVDPEYFYGFGYGEKYPPELAHLTKDGKHHGRDILTPVGSTFYCPVDCDLYWAGTGRAKPEAYFGLHLIGKFWRREGLAIATYRWIAMHLSKTMVRRVNGKLKANQVVGLTGDSGSAKNHPHLHFEAQKLVGGVWVPVNPAFLIGEA